MKWIKDGLSIDETKTSTIIIMAVVSLGVGLYIALTQGDIPPQLTSVITVLALTVAGEYGINSLSGVLNSNMMSKLNANVPNTKSQDSSYNYYEED